MACKINQVKYKKLCGVVYAGKEQQCEQVCQIWVACITFFLILFFFYVWPPRTENSQMRAQIQLTTVITVTICIVEFTDESISFHMNFYLWGLARYSIYLTATALTKVLKHFFYMIFFVSLRKCGVCPNKLCKMAFFGAEYSSRLSLHTYYS